jgi:acyl-CoA synthetase (AMP-forming)/AMP-acid ligase II
VRRQLYSVAADTPRSAVSSVISYASPEHQLSKPGTSGRPYDEVQITIVDEDWNRLPAGQIGEIAVNTLVVIRSYLGRDKLGEDAIRDGFYRTGDVGKLDDDGFLFITDRIKDMIVAGGVNVYPAEIEKALVAHPQVIDAAVIGIPQDDFGEQPMAFIVPDPRSVPYRGGSSGLPRRAAGGIQEAATLRIRYRAAAEPDGQGPQNSAARAVLARPPNAMSDPPETAPSGCPCPPR